MSTTDMLEPELHIDAAIELNELNPKIFAIVRQFQPYGPDNMRPAFYAKGVEIAGYPRVVGKATGHLKFQVRSSSIVQGTSGGGTAANLTPFTLGGATIEAIG